MLVQEWVRGGCWQMRCEPPVVPCSLLPPPQNFPHLAWGFSTAAGAVNNLFKMGFIV